MKPIRVLDLFAGCGGLTEGFHQFRPTGGDRPVFSSVGAVEWDKAAAASYAMNFGFASDRPHHFEPPEIFCRDIVGWEPPSEAHEIDVVVGGPPCQGFSGLNRNKVRAERNQLWQEFIRVVVAVQPKVFVIENVDRFVRSPEFADLRERMGNGDLENYSLVEAPGSKVDDTELQRARRYLLNAADYGTPQVRRRTIVIGVRTDAGLRISGMQYPEPTHSREILLQLHTLEGLESSAGPGAWVTVDKVFAESAGMDPPKFDFPDHGSIRVDGVGEVAGPFTTSQLHICRRPERVSLARYDAIPPGGNRKDLRGRYLCRFDDDGSQILIGRDSYRDELDQLRLVGGPYVEVIGGKPAGRTFTVVAQMEGPALALGHPFRNRSRSYRVVVQEGISEREASLTYLSTDAWDRHDAGSGDVMGRLRTGSPSVTIRTEFFKPEKGRYLHPTEDRPITHYEAARLQGFPVDFRWCGSKSEIARQIGNAVPIPLGSKIAEAIYTYLHSSAG